MELWMLTEVPVGPASTVTVIVPTKKWLSEVSAFWVPLMFNDTHLFSDPILAMVACL